MSRFFRLNAEHHNCAMWTLRREGITPPLDDSVAQQVLDFSDGFWTEVFQCQSGCGEVVESEGFECLSCRSQIDLKQNVQKVLPQLRQLKKDVGDDWVSIREKLTELEQSGENRDTILNFLKE